MDLQTQLAELDKDVKPCKAEDLTATIEDIHYQFSKLEGFEILKIDQTGDPNCSIKAAIQSTVQDPIFEIIVKHIWTTDLAYDNQWCRFYQNDFGSVFEFLTWEDEFITGEIWFQRVKAEILNE